MYNPKYLLSFVIYNGNKYVSTKEQIFDNLDDALSEKINSTSVLYKYFPVERYSIDCYIKVSFEDEN